MLTRLLKLVLIVLIGVGLWRGFVNYDSSTGDNVLVRLGTAIVNTVADLTYQWIPEVIKFFEWLFSGVAA